MPKGRDGKAMQEIAHGLEKGLSSQGHMVAVRNLRSDECSVPLYDYVVIMTESTSAFGGAIPPELISWLKRAGKVSGMRCCAIITKGGIRKMKTLSVLMNAMEGEGMYLKYSETIDKPSMAEALGKRLNCERNL